MRLLNYDRTLSNDHFPKPNLLGIAPPHRISLRPGIREASGSDPHPAHSEDFHLASIPSETVRRPVELTAIPDEIQEFAGRWLAGTDRRPLSQLKVDNREVEDSPEGPQQCKA
ncbi:hypothetical protein [uncultured Rubinisphaera sp.]|uniref:hypothetical protein n=1 Tax=uncultured Rubinisphaera sp. TaxID=1678686 RepID=UPI0030DA7F3D